MPSLSRKPGGVAVCDKKVAVCDTAATGEPVSQATKPSPLASFLGV